MKRKNAGKKLLAALTALALICVSAPYPEEVPVSGAQTAVPSGVWTSFSSGAFAGGDGTRGNPYRIETAEQLAYLAVMANTKDQSMQTLSRGQYYQLTENVDLSAHRWIPIGQGGFNLTGYENTFSGFFDGGGHTITGLYVDETQTQCWGGLFSRIGAIEPESGDDAIIRDLKIVDAQVISCYDNSKDPEGNKGYGSVGILCGSFSTFTNDRTKTLIKNVSVSGTVTKKSGQMVGGGLIGDAQNATLDNCSADVSVLTESEKNVYWPEGGLIGDIWQVELNNCSASGTVVGTYALGGLIGRSSNSIIKSCSVSDMTIRSINSNGDSWNGADGGCVGVCESTEIEGCDVAGTIESAWSIGGFIGQTILARGIPTRITNCTAKVNINASDWNAGGFAGYINGGTIIENCAAYGDVISSMTELDANTGGFAGTNEGGIINCFAAGAVINENGARNLGGFIGYSELGGSVDNSYYDADKNATLEAVGGVAQTATGTNNITGVSTQELECRINGHQMPLQKTEEVPATGDLPGKKAYYTCQRCGMHFEDENGEKEIEDLDSYGIIPPTGNQPEETTTENPAEETTTENPSEETTAGTPESSSDTVSETESSGETSSETESLSETVSETESSTETVSETESSTEMVSETEASGEQPSEEIPSGTPGKGGPDTTTAATKDNGSAPAAAAVKKPGKVRIKKIAEKKKSSKKIKITLKKIRTKGFQIAVYKTRKNAKRNKNPLFKTVTATAGTRITLNSVKLKNKKVLYLRVRAYNVSGKKKFYGAWGAWSKIRRVKIK